MKTLTEMPRIYLIFFIIALVGSACSENLLTVEQRNPNNQITFVHTNPEQNSRFPESETITVKAYQSPHEGMLVFDGSVFVAATKPTVSRWHLAGWQIARQSLSVEADQVPVDCTLYRHLGVEGQWIGSCSGYTLIPEDGASHIAVMHTQPDGTSILVQVAPPPDPIRP